MGHIGIDPERRWNRHASGMIYYRFDKLESTTNASSNKASRISKGDAVLRSIFADVELEMAA